MTELFSPLQKARLQYQPSIVPILQNVQEVCFEEGAPLKSSLIHLFPSLAHFLPLRTTKGKAPSAPKRVGVVLSGGQAPGGHNVITGLFDALQEHNPESTLIGFLNGPSGIIKNKSIPLTREYLASYRNQGGFHAIGSGRTKIETPEQFHAALECVKKEKLDGLVIVGGDDSNTNAAFLAEYFLKNDSKTCVVGVPKTIDGDLQNEAIEISFGFDTACKVYAETIGNICSDALSAKKYTFFIKLMGRSASHIALECALQTQPNVTLIGEEILSKKETLHHVVDEIANVVEARSKQGKEYGVIIIPEGLIEFLVDVKALIRELNRLLATESKEPLEKLLSSSSRECFLMLPASIREQLLFDRDPHGNVQVSKIETERLLMTLVSQELKKRNFQGAFSPVPIFCGYEGRSALPSNFDATYCYNLGRTAACLIHSQKSGYMAAISNLAHSTDKWQVGAAPILNMLHLEERHGEQKAVIQKALVDLNGKPFQHFASLRENFKMSDLYRQPGPIQFQGAKELTDGVPALLSLKNG